MRKFRWLCWIALGLTTSACIDPTVTIRRNEQRATAKVQRADARAATHTVERGDTLYGIAFRYQLDFRDLAQRNSIYEPYVIYPGQRLQLRADAESADVDAEAGIAANSVRAETSAVPDTGFETSSAVDSQTGVSTAPGTIVVPVAGSSETLPPSVVPASEGFVSVSPTPSAVTNPNTQAQAAASTIPASAAASSTAPASAATAANSPNPTPSPAPSQTVAAVNTPSTAPAVIPSAAAAGAPKPSATGWAWPTEGRLLSTFSANDPGRQGIDIRGTLGQAVYAAKAGTVVYSGQGIRGYGELIVIKHDDATLSAYGHNSTRLAKEGQAVQAGAMIAEMGQDPQGRALLHFEVRRNGKPVDPLGVLPKR
jgi:lipoprotein NlpD